MAEEEMDIDAGALDEAAAEIPEAARAEKEAKTQIAMENDQGRLELISMRSRAKALGDKPTLH